MSEVPAQSTVSTTPDPPPAKAIYIILILLDILNNLLVSLRSIISGHIRIHQIHTRVWDNFVASRSSDKSSNSSSASSQASESQDQDSDSEDSESNILKTSLRDLCKAIVRRDLEIISRFVLAYFSNTSAH